jgi:hypothetical protein
MLKTSEATLVQRAGYLYRHLLLIRRLFQQPDENDTVEFAGDTEAEVQALRGGIREVLDELTEQARVITTVPFPLREWHPGDGPDDERWRALSEVERREMLSLVSAYEDLITWAEGQTHPRFERIARDQNQESEYLRAERARVARFRQDMAFLDRRRNAEGRLEGNETVGESTLKDQAGPRSMNEPGTRRMGI